MKKIIIIIVLVILCSFWYSSNSYTSEPVVNYISEKVADYIVPVEKSYHYSQLDDSGRFVYDELLRQVPSGATEFSIKDVPEEVMQGKNFSRIIDAFYNDHPEFFWIGNGYEWTYSVFFRRMDLILYTKAFWNDDLDKNAAVDEFFLKADEIIVLAGEFEDEYEQVKFVHDYLIDNIAYDDNAAEAIDEEVHSVENSYAYSGYGALVNDLCVCEGYSKAFQLIMQNLGYECILASGEGIDDLHSWNMLKLGDDYYFFDLTWDDEGDLVDEDGKMIYADGNSHNYFAVRTKEFAREHKTEDFEYPLCTATEYNYFYREGYIVESYSEAAVKEVLKKQFDEGLSEISIKFADDVTMDKAEGYVEAIMKELMSDYKYYRYYEQYYISKNDKMLIITYNFV